MSDLTLGVDVSDVIARLAIVDKNGETWLRAASSRPTVPPAIKDAGEESRRGAQAASWPRIAVAMPSASDTVPEDLAAGACRHRPKGRRRHAVAAGTAAAIAEQWIGVAKGAQQVIAFSIAEHVTAGVLIDGKPWLGAHGLASAVGWMALNPVEREDYRRYGGLEAEVAVGRDRAAVRVAHQVRRSIDGGRSGQR